MVWPCCYSPIIFPLIKRQLLTISEGQMLVPGSNIKFPLFFHSQIFHLSNHYFLKNDDIFFIRCRYRQSKSGSLIKYVEFSIQKDPESEAEINTNNGVESSNRLLKYNFLHHAPDKTMTAIVTIIFKDFLADQY